MFKKRKELDPMMLLNSKFLKNKKYRNFLGCTFYTGEKFRITKSRHSPGEYLMDTNCGMFTIYRNGKIFAEEI